MDIRYKFIKHEVIGDSPFVGAVICADSCKLKCKGCHNRDLKKMPTQKATAKEIVQEVLDNWVNQGIILGGLEWSYQPMEMLELCKEASEIGLEVMIYTGLELNEFRALIGRECCKQTGFSLPDTLLTGDDTEMQVMIGAMILDTYIPNDYYIKCGRYDREREVADRVHFGIKLATENQNVYKFEKEKESK